MVKNCSNDFYGFLNKHDYKNVKIPYKSVLNYCLIEMHNYSARKASIGLILTARWAGMSPANAPEKTKIPKAAMAI